MSATHLGAIVTTDLIAVTRGRFVSADRIDGSKTGAGWVPANITLDTDGRISPDNPWGTAGDLRILPDPGARYVTASTGAPTPFDMTMGDLVTPDGAPWSCCTRTLLRTAIADFEAATGLRLLASFEQEFQIVDTTLEDAHVFSFAALRRIEPFASRYFNALEEAGIDPETIIAEYGERQFEITSRPADALTAADRAVAIREITREMCRAEGRRASFAPKIAPDQVGNGVHVHFSLLDGDGNPATFEASKPGRLSETAGAFCAGIVTRLPAMLALTAPSPASYIRLRPQGWSPTLAWLAEGNRGAALRICPTLAMSDKNPAAQFNIEYRAADATANPYLVVAALLRAGLDGIKQGLVPKVCSDDPNTLEQDEVRALGLHPFPETLDAALDRMQASETVKAWFPAPLLDTFLYIKRKECDAAHEMSEADVCAAAARRY